MTNEERERLVKEANTIGDAEKELRRKVERELLGKPVTILDAHYNGQVHGHSKPKLTGKRLIVSWVGYQGGELYVGLVGHQATCSLRDIEP